ncbi:inner-membrane translocator [Demequina sp. SYSU T00039]|uniref:Inner-membrane translocator n=1 Tax=Demequina lignilytica TaxID=3051663 RepID=A0AAW7LZS4_9MICO|nr:MULTISPECIES: inner-membrane translocator [unclassified Demequina]MDN4486853.1 inner-membrane translocator [Demequina sp. SYSU T00039]MDN4489537.1 inner-membrane translocator [Demequina sp. SYSU T00068]
MHDLNGTTVAQDDAVAGTPATPTKAAIAKEDAAAAAKARRGKLFADLAPLIGLAVLAVAFVLAGTSAGTNMGYAVETLVNQSVIVIIIATGAIFIFAMGSFDISLGASTLVAAMVAGLVHNATGNLWLMLGASVLAAVTASLISATLAAVFNLPVFVTTVAMLSVLGAVAAALVQTTGGAQIRIDRSFAREYDTLTVKIIVAVAFLALCVFLFNYTRLGRVEKLMGGNPVTARLTGVSMKLTAIAAFAIAGLGVGLGAFLTALRTPTLTVTSASDIGMNILVAMVFGGMVISGGPRSRIYAAIIGGISMALLNQTMSIMLQGMAGGAGIAQMVRAVLFLAVVWLAASGFRTKVLPR